MVFEKPIQVIRRTADGGYFTGEVSMSAIAIGVYVLSLITDKEALSYKVGKF